SNAEPMSTARAESRAAFAGHADDGVAAVLEDFVRRTAQPGVQGEAVAGGDGNGGGGGGGFPWLPVIVVGGAGLFAVRAVSRGRRRRAEEQAAFADVRRTADEDI